MMSGMKLCCLGMKALGRQRESFPSADTSCSLGKRSSHIKCSNVYHLLLPFSHCTSVIPEFTMLGHFKKKKAHSLCILPFPPVRTSLPPVQSFPPPVIVRHKSPPCDSFNGFLMSLMFSVLMNFLRQL